VLLHLPSSVGYAIEASLVVITFVFYKFKKISFSAVEQRLLILLGSMSIGVLAIYLNAKNPVWTYHFIGTDIIFMLALGLLLKKTSWLKCVLGVYALIVFIGFVNFQLRPKPMHVAPDLFTKESATAQIIDDAGAIPYTVFAYNPSIYTYEYAYLFRWLANKEVPFDPGQIAQGDSVVYLLFPPDTASKISDDFSHFHTPDAEYTTAQTWNYSDGSIVIKRVKNK